ncbi:MAG: heavy-metal-associated domain-containing protein [Stagnimonas sp.]|nr:heavy-metal-associated domain-containing protein [Stagnimonas sp.]
MIRTLSAALIAATLSLAAAAAEAPRSIEMKVDGLVCAFCAQGIAKKLGQMEATQEVLVSLETGLVAVALKPGQGISDEALRATLTEAGYSVQRIERKDESLAELRLRLKATRP